MVRIDVDVESKSLIKSETNVKSDNTEATTDEYGLFPRLVLLGELLMFIMINVFLFVSNHHLKLKQHKLKLKPLQKQTKTEVTQDVK